MTSLKQLSHKAEHIEASIKEIFIEKGIVAPDADHSDIPKEFRSFRHSVAAVIVPKNWESFLGNMEDMPIGMGVQTERGVLEFLGGGLTSEEELEVQNISSLSPESLDARLLVNGNIPGYLYFLMQGSHLLDHGKLFTPTYELRSGMDTILKKELGREIEEEAGSQAKSLVELGEVFPLDAKKTILSTLGFGNLNDQIEEKMRDQGVRFTPDKKKLLGFLLEIGELGMLGLADLEQLVEYAERTEEVRGMMSITIGDLLARGEEAIAHGLEGWNGWDKESQGNKPRNDSVFYLLRAFLEYAKSQKA